MLVLRSLLRIVCATLLALTVLSVMTYHGFRWYGERRLSRATESFVEHHGSLDLASFVTPSLRDNENAAFWFLKGANEFQWEPDDRHDIALAAATHYADWSAKTAKAVQLAEGRNPEALALFAFAAIILQADFAIDYSRGTGTNTPSVLRLMSGARLVASLVRRDLAHGEDMASSKGLLCLKGLAESLQSEIDINTQYAGWAVEAMLLNVIHGELKNNPNLHPSQISNLEQLIPATDASLSFETFLKWRVASRLSLNNQAEPSPVDTDIPLAILDTETIQRAVQSMIRDLRAALQLEDFHREFALYSTSYCDAETGAPVSFDDPVFSDIDRFINWMRATLVARHVMNTTIGLLGHDILVQDSGQTTTSHGETISWTTETNGVVVVQADQADKIRTDLFARRYNPPPPLKIRLQVFRRGHLDRTSESS